MSNIFQSPKYICIIIYLIVTLLSFTDQSSEKNEFKSLRCLRPKKRKKNELHIILVFYITEDNKIFGKTLKFRGKIVQCLFCEVGNSITKLRGLNTNKTCLPFYQSLRKNKKMIHYILKEN